MERSHSPVPAWLVPLAAVVLWAPVAVGAELTGLWKASRRLGPEARGPLLIERAGDAYVADMAGLRVPVRTAKDTLTFHLPNGQGSFRGRLERDGAIRGHWYPPQSSLVGWTASPVRLAREATNRWSGRVEPLDDEFTFYLLLEPGPDGTTKALLRNPERDLGSQWGVQHLVREDTLVRLTGRRRGETSERELVRGTYSPANDVITLVFPGRGGSYDFRKEGDESFYWPRGKHPARYAWQRPPARNDGWETGTLDEAKIDRAAIERLVQRILDAPMDSAARSQVHGVLIARHGKLVLEEYFHGEHRDKLHATRSASKSLTAALVGAAIEAGAPLRLSSPVYEVMNRGAFPAGLDSLKRAMTLEHLLSMTSGFDCDDTDPKAPGNEENMLEQTDEPDTYRFALAVPMATRPGEGAVYCSINPNLALAMVGRATGEFPLDAFDRLLGGPLGIERYAWGIDPAGNPYGGGGAYLLPRDFMKLGQLMLDGGTWRGRRILDRAFVERASSPHYHLRNITYGYLWWGVEFPYKDRTVYAYYAGGAGGQGVTVIPELDLVIANYGGSYTAGQGSMRFFLEYIPRYVLPAVREPGDDLTAPVADRVYWTPYGASKINGPVTP